MNKTQAIKILDKYRNKGRFDQQANKKRLIDAFRTFWKSEITEAEFAKHTDGLVLFSELLYIIAQRKC